MSRARALAVCALALAGCGGGGDPLSPDAASEQAEVQTVRITARRWAYEPANVELSLGVPVVLELTSADVHHGFNLPEFKLQADVLPGQVTKVELTPDQPGTFPFHCDYYCGSGHEQMEGQIVVK